MGLESASVVSDLNENWPTGSDPKSQGDDHLRLIKKVIRDNLQPASSAETAAGTSTTKVITPATLAEYVTDELYEFEQGLGFLAPDNNLSDVTDADTSRGNLEAAAAQDEDYTGDLNDLSESGIYKIGGGSTNGWPGFATGDVLLHMEYDGDDGAQIGSDADGTLYTRRKEGTSGWGPWEKLAKQSDLDDLGSTLETVNTGSGTTAFFSGLPSSVTEIHVLFDDVSLDGSDNLLVRIGDNGGLETTGYKSGAEASTTDFSETTGFIVPGTNAAAEVNGVLSLYKGSGNKWHAKMGVDRGSVIAAAGGGSKELSSTLDRLGIVPSGSDNFDGGSISIRYR